MQIGNIQIKTPVFLAPMAGITDYSFRILCKEQGAAVVYSEFVSAEGIIRGNTKTIDMIRFTEAERPIGIQIFGSNPEAMAKAARYISTAFQPDIIDINYGCPVPKITKRGAGSAALKDLNLMEDITQAVIEAVPDCIVTVKMRAGWSRDTVIVPEAGGRLENLGVKAITLHPRTATQSFRGKADWNLIRELKQSVSIPVIGNGDINTPDDVNRMVEITGCDGVMIGRAALGNPWIFRDISRRFSGLPPLTAPTIVDKMDMCRRHLKLLLENRGGHGGFNIMKKHFGWYIKGFYGAATFRHRLITATKIEEIDRIFQELQSLGNNSSVLE